MNILFVNHGNFRSNSAIHVFGFANQLVKFGHDCIVAVPDSPETVSVIGAPLFAPGDFGGVLRARPGFKNGLPADIVHAWTPRENVRAFVASAPAAAHCKYFVHLEDNEEFILEQFTGLDFQRLRAMRERSLRRLVPAALSHPRRYRQFLESADGITIIIERLRECVPAGIPSAVLWPGIDFELFDGGAGVSARREDAGSAGEYTRATRDAGDARQRYGLSPGEHVLVYTGNVHKANAREVRNLYAAVKLLNDRGAACRLLRTGVDHCPFLEASVEAALKHVINLGFLPWAQIPSVIGLADVVVQPGSPGPFNDFRLPSKLPEFLAMARAVILPATNLGLYLQDGVNAVLLKDGSAGEIAALAEGLFSDCARRESLGREARKFSREHFDWAANTRQLLALYETTPARGKLAHSKKIGTRLMNLLRGR